MKSAFSQSPSLWRHDAAAIVESLFPKVSREHWDRLLDLRQLLLGGTDWDAALDIFLECRVLLEADHYLPFYRLRVLLCGSLQLESLEGSLLSLLRKKHRSLEGLRRAVSREIFEKEGTPGSLRVVETI